VISFRFIPWRDSFDIFNLLLVSLLHTNIFCVCCPLLLLFLFIPSFIIIIIFFFCVNILQHHIRKMYDGHAHWYTYVIKHICV
jgi:hypothetical protein